MGFSMPTNMENRDRLGYKEGFVSIIVNLVLFGIKYWAGIVSGSIALIADAWHTLSDAISSVIVIAGVKLSSQKPDKEHPFGHGRWEQIAALFIGFLLALIAFEFLKESIVKFNAHQTANFGTIALTVTIASIIVKELLAQYALIIARKTGNISIKADAWHHRSDALSSVFVLIGIFLKDYFWWIDSVLGIIISLMLFYAVYTIIKDAINKLLGEDPSKEMVNTILDIIAATTDIETHPHHFHIHDYGIHKELTFHIKLENETDIATGHRLATAIEQNIFKELNIETTIHVEPIFVQH